MLSADSRLPSNPPLTSFPRPTRMRFFMRCVAIRHDASTYMYGRIVTDRNATHEKRIRVGRALPLSRGRLIVV